LLTGLPLFFSLAADPLLQASLEVDADA
jgi:hypothetical protein